MITSYKVPNRHTCNREYRAVISFVNPVVETEKKTKQKWNKRSQWAFFFLFFLKGKRSTMNVGHTDDPSDVFMLFTFLYIYHREPCRAYTCLFKKVKKKKTTHWKIYDYIRLYWKTILTQMVFEFIYKPIMLITEHVLCLNSGAENKHTLSFFFFFMMVKACLFSTLFSVHSTINAEI